MNNEEKRIEDGVEAPIPAPEETLPAENSLEEAQSVPAESAAPEEAPQEEAPQEEAPQEEAPQEEAPQEEAPQEEAPEEETPEGEEASAEDSQEAPQPAEEGPGHADQTPEDKEPTVQLDGQEVSVAALLADIREVTQEDQGLHLIDVEAAEEPAAKPEKPAVQEAAPGGDSAAEEESTVKLNAEEYLIDTPAYMGLEGDMPKKKRRRRHAHFFYYIGEALRGMRAHGFMSFASVGIITACLLLMGCFAMVVLNLNSTLNTLMDRNEFLAYVDESYSREEAESLQSAIEAIPNVSQVTFITKEDAMETYVDNLGDNSLYTDLPSTILRDRYSVHVEDLASFEDTCDQVEAIEGIVKVSAELKVAQGFVTIRNIAMVVAAVLVLILFAISLFIMSNTIKLATINRGDEIAIMRMCGATNRFIRWPFIYEGAILGLLGAGISYGLLRGLYYLVMQALDLSGRMSLITVVPFQTVSTYVLAVFLVAGLVIGVGGSSGTIRKFLKV